MKQIIRLTESDLHRLVKESVQKILNEGLTPMLARMAKQHGGVKKINKSLQLDKNDLKYQYKSDWDDKNYETYVDGFVIEPDEKFPFRFDKKRFFDTVCVFNDGTEYVIYKPEFQKSPEAREKLETILQAAKNTAAKRSEPYPGHTWTEREYERDDDGTTKGYDYTHTVTPEQERQAAHKKARGKKTTGIGKGSDRHYWRYVSNYLRGVAESAGGVEMMDGYLVPMDRDPKTYEYTPEAEKIADEFYKFGYSEYSGGYGNKYKYLVYDEDRNKINPEQYYVCFENGTYDEDDWENERSVTVDPKGYYERPKIGTSEFMKQNGQQ
jgi:hypothetical protein